MKKLTTLKQKAKEKGYTFYGDETLLKYAPVTSENEKIEIFSVGKYISDNDLEEEYRSRGLIPASPEAILNSDIDKKYIITQWKYTEGNWCCATFSRWNDGREMDVYRGGGGWGDRWWFCGVKKKEAFNKHSEPLSLGAAIEIVKNAGLLVYKQM